MAYTSDSASDRLAAVRAAIDRCLTSQEYQVGPQGQRQRMADLKTLRDMERELQTEAAAASESGGSMTTLCEMGAVR